jgi:hypothetical protein
MKLLTLLISAQMVVMAQSSYADSFLRIGTSSRTISLGQAVVAMHGHPQSYLYNPAGSALSENSIFSVLAVNQFSLADYYSFSVTRPFSEKLVLGFHGVGLLIDHILERPDIHGISDIETRRDTIRALVSEGFSSFSNRETAWTLTIAKLFQYNIDLGWQTNQIPLRCPVGVNVRYIQKSLHELNGRGIGIDVGGIIQVPLGEVLSVSNIGLLTVGGSMTNIIGTKIFWSSQKEDLIPMNFIWGASYQQDLIFAPVTAEIFYQKDQRLEKENQYGLELAILKKIYLRCGKDDVGQHGGIGFEFIMFRKNIDLGYSFLSHDLGKAHRFDFTIGLF